MMIIKNLRPLILYRLLVSLFMPCLAADQATASALGYAFFLPSIKTDVPDLALFTQEALVPRFVNGVQAFCRSPRINEILLIRFRTGSVAHDPTHHAEKIPLGLQPQNRSRRGSSNLRQAWITVTMALIASILRMDIMIRGENSVLLRMMDLVYFGTRALFQRWPSLELSVLAILTSLAARGIYELNQSEKFPRDFALLKDIKFDLKKGADDAPRQLIVMMKYFIGPILFLIFSNGIVSNPFIPGDLMLGVLMLGFCSQMGMLGLRYLIAFKATPSELGIKAIGIRWKFVRWKLEAEFIYWKKEPHILRWIGQIFPIPVYIIRTSHWTSMKQKLGDRIRNRQKSVRMLPAGNLTLFFLILLAHDSMNGANRTQRTPLLFCS